MEARPLFPARRRRPARGGGARMPRGAQRLRHFRCVTLGKIEVVGPDAVTFMNRMYANAWTSLAVGRCRYGVLLREDGFVLDDGVVARTRRGSLSRHHHHRRCPARAGADGGLPADRMAGAAGVADLDHRAVGGDRACRVRTRARVLEAWCRTSICRAAAMPHMSVARGAICGVPVLLFRVSFTGELGFEVNVPADYGRAVWEAIYPAGAELRHHPLWHRGHARSAGRERLHHHRPGDRRYRDRG